MTNAIDEITDSLNFDEIFTYTTGELCKLSSVIHNAELFIERKLAKEELEELKDYFIEHIEGNAQEKANEMIKNDEIENLEDFSVTEFQQEWLDKYVDVNLETINDDN